ncbi:MAG: type I DNA topoisomerase [Chloroflexi bacterium]|nr:type I DNA topoisomerase [Chloroflexota bacterium]NOG34430.1 type I DNA topoisomerase [Chloroflexota bacterium]
MEEIIGYCFKCKEKHPMVNPQAEWSAHGAPGVRGTCANCGGAMYKAMRTPEHESLAKPENIKRTRKPVAKKGAIKKGGKSARTKVVKAKKPAAKDTAVSAKLAPRRSGKLVVVESPAKAKTISRYLGKGYVVKSSVGHVRDLLKSRLSVDVDNNFEPEYRVSNDKRDVVKELKEAAARATEIYLATDPDREGEAIAWHVREAAEMDPARTRRVEFHEITKPAIQKAFEQPREIDIDRVNAQQARRILDRLVGYKLSPLLWRKVHGRLSAGRVQSVAVRLVVDREREIQQFVIEEYWTLAAELSQQTTAGERLRPSFTAKLFKLNGEDPVFRQQAEVQPHLDVLVDAHWVVGEVRLGKRTRRPAAPFTTSTLQQEASRRLSFNTDKTMRIAQQLYEGIDLGDSDGAVGLITYMRTDSVTVSAEAQTEARAYIGKRFGATYVPVKPPEYTTKTKAAQEAHEAVRPTSVIRTPQEMKEHLSRDQYRLYTLIWDRFVASQMAPARYDTVSADVWAGNQAVVAEKRPYLFRATGSTLEFPGFLALYEESRPEDKPDDGENQVPSSLKTQEQLDLRRLLPEQHFTQPPPRYSEATLVKALEENGIGRPSTYASIISTIQQRGYVDREERRLIPTETGQVVNDLLVEYFPDIVSVDFTARLEDELDKIAEGNPWTPVVGSFYRQFVEKLEIADESIPKIEVQREQELVGRDCPACGNPLVYREGRYGRFIGCSTFPKCRFTEQIVKVLTTCPRGGQIVERRTKRGKVFYGCNRYPDCEWRSWYKPVADTNSHCDGVLVQVNQTKTDCVACALKESAPALHDQVTE